MDHVKLPSSLLSLLLVSVLLVEGLPARGHAGRVSGARSASQRSSASVVEYSVKSGVDGAPLVCPESYMQYYCLNGGKCFLLNTGLSLEYNCE